MAQCAVMDAPNCRQKSFFEMSKKRHEYKLARFVKGKRPYVEFWAYNKATQQELFRVRDYKVKTLKEAEPLIEWINEQLRAGMVVNLPPKRARNIINEPPITLDVEQALDMMVKTYPYRREETRYTYISQANLFKEYCKLRKILKSSPRKLVKADLVGYRDFCFARGNGHTTVRAKLVFVGIWMNYLKDRGYLEKNLVEDMDLPKTNFGSKVLLSAEDQGRVKEILKERHRGLYIMIHVLYHGFFRVNEVQKIKRGMVDKERMLIRLPKEVSKNHKPRNVILSPPLLGFFEEMGLLDLDSNRLLLAKANGEAWGKNYFASEYRQVIKSQDFVDAGHKLYHWKDMGASAYYRKYKDILFVKNQCGHSSLEETYRYLDKDLGVIVADLDLEGAPVF